MRRTIKHGIIIGCSIFLFFPGIARAGGSDYIKNVEVAESGIKIDHQEFPAAAYLYLTLKNNGDRKVSNITFEISYYSKDDYLIMKATVKNGLNDAIPPKETRKYKVRLRGDFVNARNEQYPYSQKEDVAEFDIKIKNVKFASR